MAINKRLIKSNDGAVAGGDFNTVLYTGNSTNDQSVTGVGFQPDLVWIKRRINNGSGTAFHGIWDSVRGTGGQLYPSLTNAETNTPNRLYSFDIDGFSLGNGLDPEYIGNSDYVAWCWKAGGAAVTNTDGTITSQVSANAEAGFSVVTYTGNGVANSNVGHGLGVAPSIVIAKTRSAVDSWHVFGTAFGLDNFMFLDTNMAMANAANYFPLPTNDVIQFGSNITPSTNGSGRTFVAYCFAEVAGFSKFGSYSGTGAAGNFQDCGFEPAFVMIKRVSGAEQWNMYDNKRNTNPAFVNKWIAAQDSEVEYTNNSHVISFSSTGFSFVTASLNINASGSTYIYMAFANQF